MPCRHTSANRQAPRSQPRQYDKTPPRPPKGGLGKRRSSAAQQRKLAENRSPDDRRAEVTIPDGEGSVDWLNGRAPASHAVAPERRARRQPWRQSAVLSLTLASSSCARPTWAKPLMDTGERRVESLAVLGTAQSFTADRATPMPPRTPTARRLPCQYNENLAIGSQPREFVPMGQLRPKAAPTAGDCTRQRGYGP